MPHLDFATFPGQVFWLFISFAALYLTVARLILPKVESVLANRDEYIAGNLEKAEKFRKTAEVAEKKLTALLHEAAEVARAELEKSVAAANEKAEVRKNELAKKLDKKILDSEMKIAYIEADADAILKTVSAEISDLIVGKIMEAA